MKIIILNQLFLLMCLCSCGTESYTQSNPSNNSQISNELSANEIIDSAKNTLLERFLTPNGYSRLEVDSSSFGYYLRNLELHPIQRKVHLYNGSLKYNQSVHLSVLQQDIDPVDLQQCADAVMRLRGEYLFQQKKFKDIHFNFLSDGKPRYFVEYSNGDYSYKQFRKYMKYIFSFANTASLKKELKSVSIKEIQPGDVFIQSGSPYGHAVIVLDVAYNSDGKRIFMLGQSYMPAQETHVLKNPQMKNSPWYEAKDGIIYTPEWTFHSDDLRRFPN